MKIIRCSFILHQIPRKIKFLWYNGAMDFTFSIGWVFGGLLIAAAGGLIVINYQKIADNLVSGVSSYDKVKLFGIITIAVGLIVAMNLHTLILTILVNFIRGGH